MGDGEKLLTHLNSALKVLLGLDIFLRVPKKKLNFVDQCYQKFLEEISQQYLIICSPGVKHALQLNRSFPIPTLTCSELHYVRHMRKCKAVELALRRVSGLN